MVKKTKTNDELAYGDLVAAQVGLIEYRGTVKEIYGPDERRKAVVWLTPEISGYIVDEPTTTVFDIDELHRIDAA